MPTHFVATVVCRGGEFLVIDYKSINPWTGLKTPIQTKFVGGTNKEYPDETIMQTRDREVLEESGLILRNSKLIWKREVNPDHTQYGYVVNFLDCQGELRKVPMVDDGDELSAPYWVPAMELGRTLFHSHQDLLMTAIVELDLF